MSDTKVCLDCGASVVLKDDELCCSQCGRVWSEDITLEEDRIPIEEGNVTAGHAEANYSPGSELAFGHGLGAGLDGKGLFRILAQGKNGPTDLPLRAMQIRLITSKLEHPTTQTMLGYASALCKDYGLHTNEESSVLFANMLGKQVRKIAGYYVVRGENAGELRRVVSALFYIFYVAGHPNEAAKLFEKLNLTEKLLYHVQTLLSVLECPKQPKKPKRKQTSQETAGALCVS